MPRVRSAETRLLMAEKMGAMAWLRGRRSPGNNDHIVTLLPTLVTDGGSRYV